MDKKQLEKLKDIAKNLEVPFNPEVLIQEGNAIFVRGSDIYRCRVPSYKEKVLAQEYRNKKYAELMERGEHYTEKGLRKVIKNRKVDPIDIDALEKDKEKKLDELKDLQLDLATQITENKKVDELKKKINEKYYEAFKLVIEISEYLSPCLEYNVREEYIKYLTCLCTEIEGSGGHWTRVWNSLEDMENSTGKIVENAIKVMTEIVYSDES